LSQSAGLIGLSIAGKRVASQSEADQRARTDNVAQEQQDACKPAETEAYYESVASEEELYLERTEEHLRAMLTAMPAATNRPAGT
jgi:hypothetical protein